MIDIIWKICGLPLHMHALQANLTQSVTQYTSQLPEVRAQTSRTAEATLHGRVEAPCNVALLE